MTKEEGKTFQNCSKFSGAVGRERRSPDHAREKLTNFEWGNKDNSSHTLPSEHEGFSTTQFLPTEKMSIIIARVNSLPKETSLEQAYGVFSAPGDDGSLSRLLQHHKIDFA